MASAQLKPEELGRATPYTAAQAAEREGQHIFRPSSHTLRRGQARTAAMDEMMDDVIVPSFGHRVGTSAGGAAVVAC
jgi:hypothetical protein